MALNHPAYETFRQVSPHAGVIVANNPSSMTLEGTNTWILHAKNGAECVVVDPGPLSEAHLAKIAEFEVASILVSHRHRDHTDGAQRLASLTGAPVHAVDERHRHGGGAQLIDGDVIEAGGLQVRVVATPGHTADSVSFVVEADRSVLTADTILGRGTSVLDDVDGSLAQYLNSLRRLARIDESYRVLPGHGPELPNLTAVATHYLKHREHRLLQIRGALQALGSQATSRDIANLVYRNIDVSLMSAAERSVSVQLEYLRA